MPTQKIDPKVIFASDAPAIDKPPVFSDKTKGWDVARANDGRPQIKEMNKIQQDTDLKILWLNENAVLPHDASINYPDGAVTIKDGSFKQLSSGSWIEFLDDFADKDAVKRGIANRYDSLLTYNIGERVVLANGDIVKSTIDGSTNDPNVDMTGWVFEGELLLEYFGAIEEADNSDAIQKAFDYLRSVGGGEIKTKIKNMIISKQCVYHDNTTVDFNNCKVTLTNAGQICSALYNADRSEFLGFEGAEIYYKYQATKAINNPNSRISSDVNAKSSGLLVYSATGFAVGDYVLVSNGYCDMWRVMERYDPEGLPASRSSQDWVRPDVDLWRCEIARIKSISGTTIVFEDELENEYKATTKTYGFFSDENNREDHVGWNYPFIERLGGASNCTFKNLKINNTGTAPVALVSYCGVNNNALDCKFEGNGQGVDFITCFNSHILRSFSNTQTFGQSIRRGSYMCIMANASAKYVGGDCPLIIWEGAQHCIANNIQVDGTGGNLNHAKIGFYFNTCWNCIGSNFTAKNVDSVVGVLFCRGNIIVNNMNGVNCGVLFGAYSTFDVKAELGTLKGDYLDAPSIYDSSLFNVSECNNIEISKLKSLEKYSSTKTTGRAHIYKSFAVDLKDIEAPNVILWNSTDDDKKYEPSKFKMKTKDCVFKLAYLTQTYDNGEAQTRRTYFRDTEIKQRLEIVCTHNTELKGVDIKGLDSNISLELTISHYTRLIDCNINNETAGIDFRGSGSAGAEYHTSLVYMRNTAVNAPTKFINYVDPSYLFSINSPSSKGKGIQYVSVLSEYPKLRTFANPAGDDNKVGWFLVEDSRQVNIESYSSADLQVASGYINDISNKWLGREVYNTSISKFMKSTGSAPTSQWVSGDGVTTITPV